jgi:formylglycine-generating enzyme required for sulfatase activity
MAASTTQLMDFTLGFAEVDRPWADWITWVLESEGYTIESDDNSDVNQLIPIDEIHGQCLIVILSKQFSNSKRHTKRLVEIEKYRAKQNNRQIVPILLISIEDFQFNQPLKDGQDLDLIGCDRATAKERLLEAARSLPLPFQPPPKPPFCKPKPPFPGQSQQQGWIQSTERRSAQGYIEKLGIEGLEDSVSLEMVQIPGGMFTMGSTEDEEGSSEDERPTRRVTVQPFLMGRYPVTQAQWRFIAGLAPEQREIDRDPSNFKGDDCPVEQVSWLDAIEFCDRLSRYTGREYRLPTEAEWEYACRGKTTTPFHFGETINPDIANYYGNYVYDQGQKGLYREQTNPVGSFKVANAFGLYDMHGNVWEWCMDHWHENYENAPTDGSAWLDKNASEDALRMRRGGSWNDYPSNCRSASRFGSRADNCYDDLGFRVISPARTLP